MVIQVKTVITLGGKRAQIGRKHERAFWSTGKVHNFFDLVMVIGCLQNGKIHYGYTEIW